MGLPSYSRLIVRAVQLIGRNYSKIAAINRIKESPSDKYTSNKNIVAAVEKAISAKKQAQSIGGLADLSKLGVALGIAKTSEQGMARVNFHFQFDFGSAGSKSKTSRQGVYLSMDVSGELTKKELANQVQERIDDWIQEHYDNDPEKRKRARVTYDFIWRL